MINIDAQLKEMTENLDSIKNTNRIFLSVLMELISWINSKPLIPESKEEFQRIVEPLETIPDPVVK